MSTPLFRLFNGAEVRLLPVRELLRIPVWKNNRIIDRIHVDDIKRDIGDQVRLLDHGYHVAILQEEDAAGNLVTQQYIVDGQHRLQVLLDHFAHTLCAEEFNCLVYFRSFETEGDLIEYFNNINKCKPQQWTDPNLILNNYVGALDRAFRAESRRKAFLRPGGCHRPYLSTDRLREALRPHFADLPATFRDAETFASLVKAWHDEVLKTDTFVLGIKGAKRREFFEKGAKIGFILAYDDKFLWITETLTRMKSGSPFA